MNSGTLFDIQRFSIHDGPGIRTTVFLKGCPLACPWCHNPEGRDTRREISFHAGTCIGCQACVHACERHCHRVDGGTHVYDRQACIRCGACVTGCYPQALECMGREMTVAEVLAEVRKDQPFYDSSGGGMTVSGGEPMLQFEFTRELLAAARSIGLHTCLETCGYAATERMLAIQPLVDLILFDIKETDPARHLQFTGVPSESILVNLRALHAVGSAMWLRMPIVPGQNDRPDHFENIARLTRELPRLLGVEVMPYHRLGIGKQARLGAAPGAIFDTPAPSAARIAQWAQELRQLGVHVTSLETALGG